MSTAEDLPWFLTQNISRWGLMSLENDFFVQNVQAANSINGDHSTESLIGVAENEE